MEKATPENICPLCGGDNNCAIVRGQAAESCWCNKANLRWDALDAIPEPSRGRQCICAACGNETVRESHDQ